MRKIILLLFFGLIMLQVQAQNNTGSLTQITTDLLKGEKNNRFLWSTVIIPNLNNPMQSKAGCKEGTFQVRISYENDSRYGPAGMYKVLEVCIGGDWHGTSYATPYIKSDAEDGPQNGGGLNNNTITIGWNHSGGNDNPPDNFPDDQGGGNHYDPNDPNNGHNLGSDPDKDVKGPDIKQTGLDDDGDGGGAAITCPDKVEFKEHASQSFGYDAFTTKNTTKIPWKSVEQGQSDKLKIKIPAKYENVFFKVGTSPTMLSVSPTQAASSAFDFIVSESAWTATQISDDDKHENEVQANCQSVDGNNISKLNIVAYVEKSVDVSVTIVNSIGHGSYNFTSASIDIVQLEIYLNKIYSQAATKFHIISIQVKDVDFDENGDGKVDNSATGNTFNAELQKIVTVCKSTNSKIQNLYFVDNAVVPNIVGLSMAHQSFVFSHSPNRLNTSAHEIGHSYFHYDDMDLTNSSDKDNLMWFEFLAGTPEKLRKEQWDKIFRH